MSLINLNLFHRREGQKSNRGSAVQIHMEGTRYGMRFSMPESPDEDYLLELLLRIPSKAYALPEDKGIVLDFQSRLCSQEFLTRLMQSVIWDKKIRVLAWLSTNEKSLRLFRSAGLSVTEPETGNRKNSSEDEKEDNRNGPALPGAPQKGNEKGKDGREHERTGTGTGTETGKEEGAKKGREGSAEGTGPTVINYLKPKIVYNSMRSGRIVKAQGDVLLWGHLNPGAEIVSEGSVIVAGRLRGLVHAGRGGREDVFVWAGSFEAPQVRLGHKLCYAGPETLGWGHSVLITLEEGRPTVREKDF